MGSHTPMLCGAQEIWGGGGEEVKYFASAYKELLVTWREKKNRILQNQVEKSKQFREMFHAGSWVGSTHD